MWVRKYKQIYIHTDKHTPTFRKTISGNQARPQPAYGWLCARAWFKNCKREREKDEGQPKLMKHLICIALTTLPASIT